MRDLDMYGRPTGEDKPSGIRGWLLLAIGALMLSVFLAAADVFALFRSAPLQGWSAIWNGEESRDATLRFAALLFTSASVVVVIAGQIAMHYFWDKSHKAPAAVILYYVIWIVATVVQYYAMTQIDAVASDPETLAKALRKILRSAVWGTVWIAYFLRSDQVDRTFVR